MSFSTVLNTSKPTNTSTPVSISHSKLSANHPQLAKDIEILLNEAQRLGASVGVQRIAFVCDQYDKLTPDHAYHWIDPVGLQNEIEDTQANKSETWHIVRNCVSLLPLIFTWFALFSAASSYQNCLAAHQCEVTTPFLALWQQDGFASRTFTFASAALLDVFLLLTYLLLIIITFWLDRRAHITSIVFAKKFQGTTESLMKIIADEDITPLASEADVDKVSHAVQQVVDKAVEMSKQVARNAEESSQRAIQGTQAMSQQAIQAAQQSTQQALQSAHQSIQEIVQTAQQAIQASQRAVQEVVQGSQQSTQQAVQSTRQSMQEIVQTAQQAIQASQLAVQQVVQGSHQATQQLVQSTQQAIADSNSKVEDLYTKQVMPLMTTFHQDMSTLHVELENYQGRLNELTSASRQLAGVSATLATNADRYITIGQDISTQIAALNTTQQYVLGNISTIAGNISTAAQNMSAATAGMSTATKAVETVATQLTTGMQVTINTMTNQVGRATQSLGQVGTELQTTTYYLNQAAKLLSSLQFGSGGGLIGWFVRNRYNRRRGAGVQSP